MFAPLSRSLLVHIVVAFMLWLHLEAFVPARLVQVTSIGPWLSRAALSAIPTNGIGSLFWSRWIATIGVGQTATYLSWVPIFGVSFGALFLQEPVTVWHLVGLAAVIAGSFLVVRQR